jgi:hypothetical protein
LLYFGKKKVSAHRQDIQTQ